MKKHSNPRSYARMALAAFALVLFLSVRSTFAAEPINVGFSVDFSGVNKASGIQEAPVVEMVVKEINASGGINGRPINLIIQDNGSDPAKALGNAKMFKDHYKCKVVIANTTSSVALALKNWGDKNHIPVITHNPQSDKLWDKAGKSWFFRAETPASPRAEAILARLKKLGYDKIAYEGTALAWGSDTLSVLKEKAPAYGIKIISEVLVEPKTKDLTIQAKKLKDSGAQALITAEYDAETASLARALNAVGWKPHVIHVSSAQLVAGMTLAQPELFNGWEVNMQMDPQKPLIQKIANKTKAFTGGKIVTTVLEDDRGPRAYDAVGLLVEALKLSGNPDNSTAIRDAFYRIKNYERALGPKGSKGGFVEGRNHLLEAKDMVFSVVKGGKLVAAK